MNRRGSQRQGLKVDEKMQKRIAERENSGL
jgi:hypothetical protein